MLHRSQADCVLNVITLNSVEGDVQNRELGLPKRSHVVASGYASTSDDAINVNNTYV